MPELKIVFESGQKSTHELSPDEKVFSLGRLVSNTIALPFSQISRYHAEIQIRNNEYFLVDLNSTNGTYLNQKRIDSIKLSHEDQIIIGPTSLTFLNPPVITVESSPLCLEKSGSFSNSTLNGEEEEEKIVELIRPSDPTDFGLFQTNLNASSSLEQNNKTLYVLYQISQKLNETSDFDELLTTIMDLIFEVVHADSGLIVTLDGENTVPRVIKTRAGSSPISDPIQLSRTVFEKVIRQKSSILTSNLERDLDSPQSIIIQDIRSIISVPIWQKSEVIGLIQLNSFNLASLFTKEDLTFLHTLSSQISMIIERANLTERVRLTESLEHALQELKQRQVQLVHSEKMAGLVTMVAGAAHELNNPNNFIHHGVLSLQQDLDEFKRGFFQLLEGNDEEFQQFFAEQLEPVLSNLEIIREGSQRVSQIVTQLRTFSRLDEAEYKNISLVESIQSSLFLVQANYSKQVNFIQDFQVEPVLKCRPVELNQAFMHLMINACLAIISQQQETGDKAPGQLTIRTFRRKQFVGISFLDTGCGMSQEIQNRIFEPFFTTREVGEGTGLGLSTTYTIIEKDHHGSFEVESTPAQGTKITVFLPLTPESVYSE